MPICLQTSPEKFLKYPPWGKTSCQVHLRSSDEVLAFLFTHQMRDEYIYAHSWTEGDVLMWDNTGTVHNAVAD